MFALKTFISLFISITLFTGSEKDELIMGTKYEGLASYYGKGFHGKRTANGEIMNKYNLTCAHKTLPFGTMLEVYNPRNNKYVVLRVNDRGPYAGKRIIDVSEKAAVKLGMIRNGVVRVVATVVGKGGVVYLKRPSTSNDLLVEDSFLPRVQTREQELLLQKKREERRKNERRD